MKKSIAVAISLVLLCSCATARGSKNLSNRRKVLKSNIMNSTKDDIILKYGDGFVSSFKAGDKEAYEFQYIKVKYNMVGVIPFVALFFKDYVYSDNHLYVYFDKNGNVVDYKFLKL